MLDWMSVDADDGNRSSPLVMLLVDVLVDTGVVQKSEMEKGTFE